MDDLITVLSPWRDAGSFIRASGLWKPIVCDTVVVICVEMRLLACWSHVGVLCTPVGCWLTSGGAELNCKVLIMLDIHWFQMVTFQTFTRTC